MTPSDDSTPASPLSASALSASASSSSSPESEAGAAGQLTAATEELRRGSADRWVRVADDVLANIAKVSRRSLPISGFTADGAPFQIGEQLLISQLRSEIDSRLEGAAVASIHIQATAHGHLEDLVVELYAQFARELMPIADQSRLIVFEVLERDLGLTPTNTVIDGGHVHFSGVTRGDPHLVDPTDED